MTIKKPVQEALNEQINKEFYSSYLYMSMAAYFAEQSLGGLSNWMQQQAAEEHEHGMKIYNYIIDRGGKVELKPIDKPKSGWKGVLNVFEESLEHEKFVTASINELYELAIKEKDYPTQMMLQWFINEQVEEEATVEDIIEKIKMDGDSKAGLLILDDRLGRRGMEKK